MSSAKRSEGPLVMQVNASSIYRWNIGGPSGPLCVASLHTSSWLNWGSLQRRIVSWADCSIVQNVPKPPPLKQLDQSAFWANEWKWSFQVSDIKYVVCVSVHQFNGCGVKDSNWFSFRKPRGGHSLRGRMFAILVCCYRRVKREITGYCSAAE